MNSICAIYILLSQVIKWLTLNGGRTDFSRVLKPKIEKMGTLKKKWGPNGDPKSEKGPHGDPGPQMGTHLGAVHSVRMSLGFCPAEPRN